MLTVFEKIPEAFVHAYDFQFQTWAREFRKRGAKCAIVFDQKPGAPVILDGDGRAVAKGAWLVAEVDRSKPAEPRMVIKPSSEHDEDMIARHAREMQGVWFS